ncbi:GNAT family N-acetyltransferase [Nonomuraea sp. NPDC050310]|uniref:GNAT family N-acetyltransferase n=1 Tax=unclassified Nonomuraea TaxID=2593643 RepID=UPI0033DB56ED
MGGLEEVLDGVAAGRMPEPGAGPTILAQPSERDAGVMAFTAHSVVFVDVDREWIRAQVDVADLSAALNPPFLRELEVRTGRRVNNVDLLALGQPLVGEPAVELAEVMDRGHPRVRRALRHRDDVRVWTCPGGVLAVGRGVAGRWEVAVEVAEESRGRGVGRALAEAARYLTPGPVWAQIAPGNAASVRAFLAAGYVPVGAEALLVPPHLA